MKSRIYIDKIEEADWNQVKAIYLEGIATRNATFQNHAPTWKEWNDNHPIECRIKASVDNKVMGWAALSRVSNRSVYSGVGEVSVYVRQKSNGKGIGSLLLQKLIEVSEKMVTGCYRLEFFRKNIRSLMLHKKCGFREVGRRERIGKMEGVWRDTILVERRSNKVGNA
ncbi:N-acetyltransferase family protein [Pseudalkalibacillus hwajinpoensis]|uniref:GNAT family N-acetyltransferase n=1 Tax=Guptibacillus hwajinpoensis TaxID=208199 RepID=UPI00325BDDBF